MRKMTLQEHMQEIDKRREEREIEAAAVSASQGRTKEFYARADALGAYLKALPLTNEQNDRLIDLMVKQVTAAETDAFLWGFGLSTEIAKSMIGKNASTGE